MSTEQHTALPWAAGTDTTRGAMPGRVHITNARGLRIGWTITPDDCAFIVRACNAHADLLAALQDMLATHTARNVCGLERLTQVHQAARAAIAKAVQP